MRSPPFRDRRCRGSWHGSGASGQTTGSALDAGRPSRQEKRSGSSGSPSPWAGSLPPAASSRHAGAGGRSRTRQLRGRRPIGSARLARPGPVAGVRPFTCLAEIPVPRAPQGGPAACGQVLAADRGDSAGRCQAGVFVRAGHRVAAGADAGLAGVGPGAGVGVVAGRVVRLSGLEQSPVVGSQTPATWHWSRGCRRRGHAGADAGRRCTGRPRSRRRAGPGCSSSTSRGRARRRP